MRGLTRMVEEERYCIDVLTQIAAVRSALDGVSLSLLDSHVRNCVANGDPAFLGERADELAGVLSPVGGGLGTARIGRCSSRASGASRHRSLASSRMVEAERYCIDVIEEINVAKRTLDGVALGLVDGHVRTCMSSAREARPRSEGRRADGGRRQARQDELGTSLS